MVKRLRAREATDGTAFLERLLKPRMVPVGVLEALADTEHWLDWTLRASGHRPTPGVRERLTEGAENVTADLPIKAKQPDETTARGSRLGAKRGSGLEAI